MLKDGWKTPVLWLMAHRENALSIFNDVSAGVDKDTQGCAKPGDQTPDGRGAAKSSLGLCPHRAALERGARPNRDV